jgi:hypothetical protein
MNGIYKCIWWIESLEIQKKLMKDWVGIDKLAKLDWTHVSMGKYCLGWIQFPLPKMDIWHAFTDKLNL